MKATVVIISLLFVSRIASAQITSSDQEEYPQNTPPALVWEQVPSPTTQTLGNVERSNGDTL